MRDKAGWSDLRDQVEGEVHLTWQSKVIAGRLFYAAPKRVKAMRVHKLLGVSAPEPMTQGQVATMKTLVKYLRDPNWRAMDVMPPAEDSDEINALVYGFSVGEKSGQDGKSCGTMAVAALAAYMHPEEPEAEAEMEAVAAAAAADDDDNDVGGLLDYDEALNGPAPTGFDLTAMPDDTRAYDSMPVPGTSQAQLSAPDHELDEMFKGLVTPRRGFTSQAIDLDRTVGPIPTIDVHPVLGPEVSAILKAAAENLAAGLDAMNTIGNAE